MTEKSNRPALRFSGFTAPWEQRKLEYTLYTIQNNTLSRAELCYANGVAKNVHYGDVLIMFNEYLDVSKEKLPMIRDGSVVAKYRDSLLKNGDVIVADTAEDETVGKCCEIAGVNDEIVISGLHTIPYRPLFDFASGYLGYYMNSDSYHNQLLPLMQGIKVTSISRAAMQDTTICYPSSTDEQAQISTFFRNLDNLITLHQRKCEKLECIKKYFLENLFPNSDSFFPSIRFSGFTDPWEQRKLSEVVGVYDGIHQTPDYKDSGIMFLSVENIITLQSEKFISEEAFQRDYKVYPQKGDVLMTRIGDVGTPNVVETAEKVAYYVSLALLKPQNIDSYFLCNSILSPLFQCRLNERTLITAIPKKINKDEIGKVDIMIPSTNAEQQQIGTFFRNLDNLITLHQRQLEKLKKIKKSCLEKMFV